MNVSFVLFDEFCTWNLFLLLHRKRIFPPHCGVLVRNFTEQNSFVLQTGTKMLLIVVTDFWNPQAKLTNPKTVFISEVRIYMCASSLLLSYWRHYLKVNLTIENYILLYLIFTVQHLPDWPVYLFRNVYRCQTLTMYTSFCNALCKWKWLIASGPCVFHFKFESSGS